MKCNCLDRVNEKLKKHNARIGQGLTFTGGVVVLVAVEKIDKSKRGAAPSIIATCCPWCGKNQYKGLHAQCAGCENLAEDGETKENSDMCYNCVKLDPTNGSVDNFKERAKA